MQGYSDHKHAVEGLVLGKPKLALDRIDQLRQLHRLKGHMFAMRKILEYGCDGQGRSCIQDQNQRSDIQ